MSGLFLLTWFFRDWVTDVCHYVVRTVHILFSRSLLNKHLNRFQLLTLKVKLVWTITYISLCGHGLIFLVWIPRSRIACGKQAWFIFSVSNCFLKWQYLFCIYFYMSYKYIYMLHQKYKTHFPLSSHTIYCLIFRIGFF